MPHCKDPRCCTFKLAPPKKEPELLRRMHLSTGSLLQLKPVMQLGLLDRKACHRHGSRGSSDCEKDMKILCVPHLD